MSTDVSVMDNLDVSSTPSPTIWTLSGMTAEEIQFREKIFITTHWLISFMILFIIPIIYLMRYTLRKSDEESTYKESQIEKQTQNENVPESSEIEMEKKGSSPQIKTTLTIESHATIHSVSRSRDISATNNASAITKPYRKSTLNSTQQKWNKAFKIVSYIIVFMFWAWL